MNIDKKDRAALKAYFVKNAIPTQTNFEDLIEAALNQKDDGIVKSADNPLCIEASGDAASQKKAINFYDSFTDAEPAWVLSLNPHSDSAKAGLGISDGAGNLRLFIDRTSGKVTIDSELVINGPLRLSDGTSMRSRSDLTPPQEAWKLPSLLNEWKTEDGRQVAYFKDSMGIVHLKGRIRSGINQTTCFVLPEGYRPKNYSQFNTTKEYGVWSSQIAIVPGGGVYIYGGGKWYEGTWEAYSGQRNLEVNFDGITFRGEL